jgi:predicted Rossmann fold flavoprotein
MKSPMTNPDVLIIGGGAAGLMCAIEAGRRGRRVTVIEHANRIGKKILMSGGGRCNFTNLDVQPEHYLSANPHFCKSALARYTQWDFIDLVNRHGIAWHDKGEGELFCDVSSKQIVRMLEDECAAAGVVIRTHTTIDEVRHDGSGFELRMGLDTLRAPALVIASGGLSIPKMGATGFGYRLAEQFGHIVLPTRAGLVPLTLSGKPLAEIDGLAGVALPARARCNGQSFRSAVLYTHRGLSGPAVLQISSYWQPGDDLRLDLLPDLAADQTLADAKRTTPARSLSSWLTELLPRRLAQRLCERPYWNGSLQTLTDAALAQIGTTLNHYPVTASGTEGYRTAEVTLGGVDTGGLSSQTLASRHLPGLYFIGEVVDVTGHLGGYNFQWAWSSGAAAGRAV